MHEMIYPIEGPSDYREQNYPDIRYSEPHPLPSFVKTAEAPQAQMSAKHIDLAWVNQQEPNDLTILVKSDQNPLNVSQSLINIPKDKRTAAIKYQSNGQAQYAGVYGSYSDPSEAQQALEKLPQNLRTEAKVVNWHQIQGLNYE
jgi:septal ring-binding cell division protein DamX